MEAGNSSSFFFSLLYISSLSQIKDSAKTTELVYTIKIRHLALSSEEKNVFIDKPESCILGSIFVLFTQMPVVSSHPLDDLFLFLRRCVLRTVECSCGFFLSCNLETPVTKMAFFLQQGSYCQVIISVGLTASVTFSLLVGWFVNTNAATNPEHFQSKQG